MKKRQICFSISTFATAFGLIIVIGQSALAQTPLWDYAIDSFNDGYSFGIVGEKSPYEFYGLAILQDGDNIIVALNSNMPLEGDKPPSPYEAEGGVISYGDLFLNFSSDDFSTASAKGSLYGIRFAQSNDSKVSLGVYRNVTATSVTSTNLGFSSLSSYHSTVKNVGGTPSLADLPADTPYFNQTGPVPNVIGNGTKVADISFLSSTELSERGLDFGNYGATGSQTIGFSFDRTALPVGDFIANIFAECANDGMALRGKTEEIPEPLTILGSIAGIGYIWRRQRSQRNQADSVDRT